MSIRNCGRALSLVTVIVVSTLANGVLAQNEIRPLPELGKLSIAPEVGTSFSVGGNFVNSASETATISDTIFGLAVTVGISGTTAARDFSDVFGQPVVVGVGLNYGVSSSGEVFGRLRYVHASGDEFDALNVTVAGTAGGTAFALGAIIKGEFGSYKETDLDIGYRHFFNPGSKFRPFASVSVGLKRVDDIDLDLKFGGTSLQKIKFYDSAISYAVGLGFGFRYDVSNRVAIGMETGIRFEDDLDDDDTDLAGGGSYEKINDDGNRLEIPIMVRVTIAL